jgi:hypothetical protein
MTERLGNVLYWAGCIIAALLAAGAAWVAWTEAREERDLFFAIFIFTPAVVAWLLGRACRYVLAGY